MPGRAGQKRRLTVISHSQLETFRSCPALWGFRYAEGLRMKVKPRAPALGTCLHEGMRAVYQAFPAAQARRADPVTWLIDHGTLAVRATFEAWREDMRRADLSDEQRGQLLADADDTLAMLIWMVEHYVRAAAIGDLGHMWVVEVESDFQVPILSKPTWRLDGQPGKRRRTGLEYRGVTDLWLYDTRDTSLVLCEHKTGVGDPAAIERRVEHDPQTSGYMYAMAQRLIDGEVRAMGPTGPIVLGPNTHIGRTWFNSFRRARPRQPSINKDHRVSAAVIDTTPSIYQAALEAQQDHRGLPITDAQLERLAQLRARGDTWFARIEHMRTAAQIERWRAETLVDARRVRQAERDPGFRTRNLGHCSMPWSRACDYARVCADPAAPEPRRDFEVRQHQEEPPDGEQEEQRN